jgi:hypothetical protein
MSGNVEEPGTGELPHSGVEWLNPELEDIAACEPEDDPADTSDPAGRTEGGHADDGVGDDDDIMRYGWVPFPRALMQTWWFEHVPWSYMQLYWWMVLTANFRPRKAEYKGQVILVPRGALVTSRLALSKRSGLSRDTIDRFIRKMLQSGELEIIETGRAGTIIRICNYERYTEVPQRGRQRTGNRKGRYAGNHPASSQQQNGQRAGTPETRKQPEQ